MSKTSPSVNIILTGGGTGGSVTPLLAMTDELIAREGDRFAFTWIGTKDGVERRLTASYPFVYKAISAGKLRRYLDVHNITDLFNIIRGFFQALAFMHAHKPDLIITAGSFVSVPVVWAGRMLNIPILVHQQDILPGLAKRLMAPCDEIVTVAFEKGLADFGKKAVWVGNPVRKEFVKAAAEPVSNPRPLIMVIGGGTGSEAINALLHSSLAELTQKADVIHLTGHRPAAPDHIPHYESHVDLPSAELAATMARADIIVTRGGLGTLSEISYLGKPAVIIPIPDSHQEANAKFFRDRDAAIMIAQRSISPKDFSALICDLINHPDRRNVMAQNMKEAMKREANRALLKIIDKMIS